MPGIPIERRLENPANDGPQASGIPGEIFFSMFVDRKLDSYEWTGEFLKAKGQDCRGCGDGESKTGTVRIRYRVYL